VALDIDPRRNRISAFRATKGKSDMNKMIILVAAIAALPLAGCGKSPSDKLSDRVENAADARADAMENQADALDARAKEIRDNGKQRSDAIDAAGRNVAAMTQEERDAIVANDAAAIR